MISNYTRLIKQCDLESERDLAWGEGCYVKTLDSGKWWRLTSGVWVEKTCENSSDLPTWSLSFINSPSITIQTVAAAGNGNQLSSTKNVMVNYSVTIVSTATISGSQNGYVVLEICSTNSSTAGDWVEIGRTPNGQAVSLAVILQSVSTGGGQVGGVIPTGYYRRLRSVSTSGSPSYTYNSGQEVTINI